jgi:RNA polymerase sigma factor (sigma-70 family)
VDQAASGKADPVRPGDPVPEEFDEFVAAVEPGLRRALVAGFGADVGRDAAADALIWAWQHWPRVQRYRNPAGYLFRVGQSAARRHLRRHRRQPPVALALVESGSQATPEPGLDNALRNLSARQRAAVLLVHGYDYTLAETALAMGCSPSSVRNHIERALAKLRVSLGVDADE